MTPPTDRRTARTRRALRAALIELLETRRYDEISLKDLLDVADVGRSTFYAHFHGKDELLRWSLQALHQEIRAAVLAEPVPPAGNVGFRFSGLLLEHLYLHRPLWRRLGGRGLAIRNQEIRGLVEDLLREELARNGQALPEPQEMTLEFLTGGFLGLIARWMERQGLHSARDVDAMFQGLAAGAIQVRSEAKA